MYLTRAYLEAANLEGSDLTGAHLERAFLRGADLTRADLRDVQYLDKALYLHLAVLSGTKVTPEGREIFEEARKESNLYDVT